MITQETYDQLSRIANLSRFTSYDAKEMERLIRENFNHQYTVCTHCPQQIKHGQKLITNFLATAQIKGKQEEVVSPSTEQEEVLDQEILFPTEPEIKVDVVEAKKAGCSKCGRKRTTKS